MACSLGELAAISCFFSLEEVRPMALYWVCVGLFATYVMGYYLLAVKLAYSYSLAECLSRQLNVCYLWALYLSCAALKLEPYSVKSAFRIDGMRGVWSPQLRKILLFHISFLTSPILAVVLYSRALQFPDDTTAMGVAAALTVALVSYAGTLCCRRTTTYRSFQSF